MESQEAMLTRAGIGLALLFALSGCGSHSATKQANTLYQQREAEFNQLCRTRAGYKIHRVVTEVEGIRLLKVRHRIQDGDMLAPGAAFGLEVEDDEYIKDFLAYRYPISLADNSYGVSVNVNPGVQPGFRYVDVLDDKDGKYYRYTGSEKAVGKKDTTAVNVKLALSRDPDYDLNVYEWTLDRVPSPQPLARYAVTFEDSVIPEERAKGFASSKVIVLDMQTNEVLAEMVRYVWGPSQPTSYTPNPWLTTDKCPMVSDGSSSATRQFVDRVLVAKGATLPPMPICKSCGQLP